MQIGTRSKLLLAFTGVALGAAVVGGFALASLSKLEHANREVGGNLMPSAEALLVARAGTLEMRFAATRAVVAAFELQPARIEEYWKQREGARQRVEAALKTYASLPMSDAEKPIWEQVREGWTRYLRESEVVFELSRQQLATDADKKQNVVGQLAQEKLFDPLDALIALQTKLGDSAVHEAAASAEKARVALVLVVLVTLGVALGLAWWIASAVARALRAIVTQATTVGEAVAHGKLDLRADPGTVTFEYRPVLEAMNRTIDAFVKPIEVTAEYVDRIAKGAIPPKITDTYEGEFNRIKENLNRCIEVVNHLVEDSVMLSRAAVEGKLSTRADASKHEGDYRKIVQGVNDCLDAVVTPINEAAAVLEKLAQRDLRARVEGSYQGDHAKIQEALNATAEALHESMTQVAEAVEQVSSAAGQIASSSEAVAAGASEQASSLEETSASLESMSSMTKQAADNAQQANGLAQTAQGAATEGSAAVEQMTSAMGKIKASAEGTSQIIKDINEIAFQTNLLALNAAVEAARAGEAGRGFAVVAEEVRSLALRSKEAANKTEDLIRQSVKEAGEGEVTAKHVSEKLSDIAASVTKVSGIIAEIAATAKEQTVGIEQVTKAVMQMNQVTQQNAANSEESSSAAAELSGQSEELAAMVGTFQLQASGAKAPRVQGANSHGASQRNAKPVANGSSYPGANGTANSSSNGTSEYLSGGWARPASAR